MRKEHENRPIRFAFLIFIVIVIFSVGQLTWWLIFQINNNQVKKQLQLDKMNLEIQYLAHHINRDFQSFIDIVSVKLSSEDEQKQSHEKFLSRLLENPAIYGYLVNDSTRAVKYWGGVIDSTYYARINERTWLFFDPHFPEKIIKTHKARLRFTNSGFNSGAGKPWVSASMFHIDPAVTEELDREARRHIVMFVSEGVFFMLIILFGAFLIYRTLQRSEDLKVRQRNFIQAVTHEFRTPLTSLRLYLETLQSGKVIVEKTSEIHARMLDDCDRLDLMIDNVLQAGLYEKGGYKLHLVNTDLAADLNEYLDRLESFFRRHNVQFLRDIQPNLIVRTDYPALERAVTALVDNAIKYTTCEEKKITVALMKKGNKAEIAVIDNGSGIPLKEQERIFDRFYRIGNELTRTVKGTGLGLYLVKQIVQAHRGTVKVSSDGENQGSVFTINLPLVES
ncbi:MAG: HAMP domain-containing sensor histidine kinase [candidate division Zixibacteria bacterium]|nr:HAMP domain-containing sensor histidine kinase [candidate division Zixibacteria bacterium]